MVIDPWALEKEMAELTARGVAVDDNLVISDRAHLILPHHRALEALAEELRGSRKIGTTQRGIGPAYEDKAGRRGLRMGDLLRPAALPERLEEARRHYEQICRGAGRASRRSTGTRLALGPRAFGETPAPAHHRRLARPAPADGARATRSSSRARRRRCSTSTTARIRS